MKDPLPDTLTYKGVTIYGTVDVGYAYQTNGRPLGGMPVSCQTGCPQRSLIRWKR